MEGVVAKMIETPSIEQTQTFFSALRTAGIGVGLEVRHAGENRGKGIFARKVFEEDAPVLIEAPLVAAQDTANKVDALVCAHCFRYVGSVELQIGRRLSVNQLQSSGRLAGKTSPSEAVELETRDQNGIGSLDQVRQGDGEARPLESEEEAKITEGLENGSEEGEEHNCEEDSDDDRIPAPAETVAALLEGTLKLPLSEQFPLPGAVDCLGGCSENVYCSQACASISWEAHHKLLCTGPKSEAADTDAMREFKDFADGSNNIFHVAAQVVAATVLRARKGGGPKVPEHLAAGIQSKAGSGNEPRGVDSKADGTREPASVSGEPSFHNDEHGAARQSSGSSSQAGTESENRKQPNGDMNRPPSSTGKWDALLRAWEPFSMGWKGVWWESVACPPEMEGRPEEEAAFRASIRELCEGSLELLRTAFGREAETYGPLFSLEVYSRIIGMFELNNLALVVPSPVENYFLAIDELSNDEKRKVEPVTKPLLDALGRSYATPCEGTAFYTLQSCANHSCTPNARAFKRDQDVDGRAVLLANRRIQAGEEVTISYIDESDDYSGRQSALADYGFVCHCSKCLNEWRPS